MFAVAWTGLLCCRVLDWPKALLGTGRGIMPDRLPIVVPFNGGVFESGRGEDGYSRRDGQWGGRGVFCVII